jgi:predicted DNA-binding transcriptional regulator AlpA
MIEDKKPKQDEPLPLQNDAPPLQPNGEDRAPAGLRKMLNEKQVLAILPVGRSTLWRMCAAGQFPKPTHIATNRRIWFEDQVIEWQHEMQRRKAK